MNGPTPEELAVMYDRCTVTHDVSNIVASILLHREVYELIDVIPWWAVGVIHWMESSGDFRTHLHNGDSLKYRTVHAPQGRPLLGQPPFAWHESALDAVLQLKLNRHDWHDCGSSLWALEGYNGFGYRLRNTGVYSPYLWSFTNLYSRGKFTSDGHYDPDSVSRQAGCVSLMKCLELFKNGGRDE
jgi:lysozyme family protein